MQKPRNSPTVVEMELMAEMRTIGIQCKAQGFVVLLSLTMASESLERVRVSLESRHNIGIIDLWKHPFFPGLDAGVIRPRGSRTRRRFGEMGPG
nr:hypothetical protein CFP56_56600 [Quercus suber]